MPDNNIAKRQQVIEAYQSKTWREKVNKMSDQQVIAIYFRFKKEGKIS